MRLRYTLSPFRKEDYDISGLINSRETMVSRSICTKDWTSVANEASFSLRNRDEKLYRKAVGDILDSKESRSTIGVRIELDDKAIFSGSIIFDGIEIKSSSIPNEFTVNCYDWSKELDSVAALNLSYRNREANDIVRELLERGGFIPSEYLEEGSETHSLGFDDCPELFGRTVGYFVVTEDDGTTYRAIIDKLLFELGGFVLTRDPETERYGIRKIVKTAEPDHEVTYLVKSLLSTSGSYWENDGVSLSFPEVETVAHSPLYIENINGTYNEESGLVEGVWIEPNGFFPDTGHLEKIEQAYKKELLDRPYQEGRSKIQNRDIDLLFAEEDSCSLQVNAIYETGTPAELTQPEVLEIGHPEGPVWYPRKAWILLHNPNKNERVNLLGLSIWGTASYVTRMKRLVSPVDTKNPEEYEASYIFSDDDAKKFADFYLNFRMISSDVTTWTETLTQYPEHRQTHIGDIVVIRHKGIENGQLAVVIEEQMKALGPELLSWTFVATAVSGYKEYTSYVDSQKSSMAPKYPIRQASEWYNSWYRERLAGGSWSEDQIFMPNRYMWTRQHIWYSDGSEDFTDPYCIHGEKGDPGNDVLMEYHWSATDQYPPLQFRFFRLPAFDGKLMTFSGHPMGDFEVLDWMEDPPDPKEGERFLWVRMSTDGGITWSYKIIRTINEPILRMNLEPRFFTRNSRNWVSDDQRIEVWVDAYGKNRTFRDTRTWRITPEDSQILMHTGEETGDEESDSELLSKADRILLTVPKGFLLDQFYVHYSVTGVKEEVSECVQAVKVGTETPDRLPTTQIYVDWETEGYENTDEFQGQFPSLLPSGDPLVDGDFILVLRNKKDRTGTEPVPYRFTCDKDENGNSIPANGRWIELKAMDVPVENYSEIMMQTVAEMLAQVRDGNLSIDSVDNAYYGFFHDLGAQRGMITSLGANKIYLHTTQDGKKGAIYGGCYDENGNIKSGADNDLGFYLGADGEFKCNSGNFTGSFRSSDKNGIFFETVSDADGKDVTYSTDDNSVLGPPLSTERRWNLQDIANRSDTLLGLPLTEKTGIFSSADTIISTSIASPLREGAIANADADTFFSTVRNRAVLIIHMKRKMHWNVGGINSGKDFKTIQNLGTYLPECMCTLVAWSSGEIYDRFYGHKIYSSLSVGSVDSRGSVSEKAGSWKSESSPGWKDGQIEFVTFKHGGGNIMVKARNVNSSSSNWIGTNHDILSRESWIAIIPHFELAALGPLQAEPISWTETGEAPSDLAEGWRRPVVWGYQALGQPLFTSAKAAGGSFSSDNAKSYYPGYWLRAKSSMRGSAIANSNSANIQSVLWADGSVTLRYSNGTSFEMNLWNSVSEISREPSSAGWQPHQSLSVTFILGSARGVRCTSLIPIKDEENAGEPTIIGQEANRFDAGYFTDLFAANLHLGNYGDILTREIIYGSNPNTLSSWSRYIRIGNLRLQWGLFCTSEEGEISVSFPVAFSEIPAVTFGLVDEIQSEKVFTVVRGNTTELHTPQITSTYFSAFKHKQVPFFWIAIGRA